ncbi:MAG TPA: universal stress protein [Planktothrix sp.]|jgi:nucleotide-binding universal stress UspA family protein
MKFVVAFSSPKRSAKTVEKAAQHAKAMDAELVLLRIIPDPEKVGVVAQLISSDRPSEKAQQQIDEVVAKLKEQGVNASGLVRVGQVAKSIVKIANDELKADLIFVGTASVGKSFFMMERDPIVNYLVANCPVSLFLVRQDTSAKLSDEGDG